MMKPKNISSAARKVLPPDDCVTKTVQYPNGSRVEGVSGSANYQIDGKMTQKITKSTPYYYKYWKNTDKETGNYHLLPYHCLDVAAVGLAIKRQ